MATASAWLALVDEWEIKTKRVITASQTAFQHEKFSLQLHLETNPVPFRPSTVLSQLISGEQRRGLSTKQQKVRVKNAEHLERKLESEVRQHYEVESAQACTRWKQLHLHLSDNYRQLTNQIEHEIKHLSAPLALEVPPLSLGTTPHSQGDRLDDEAEAQRQQLLVECEWINQERFNIQEAFTNQTKKIQADYQAFIDQLDAEFITERRKILAQVSSEVSQAVSKSSPVKRQQGKASQLNRQFRSNAKRHMLVQTAPVVELHSQDGNGKDLLSNTRMDSSKSNARDVTPTNHQLQELEQRLASFKEAAEGRLKDGMQWIARQCAHMFTQLDCKEAEAKLVFLLTEQNSQDADKLLHRVESIASLLRASIDRHNGQLPGLPAMQRLPPVLTSTTTHNPARLVPMANATIGTKGHRSTARRLSEPVAIKERVVRS